MNMNGVRFLESIKLLPLLVHADIVATATKSSYVDLNLANWCSFLVDFGAMTSDSTDICTVTVEASTAGSSNATEAAIAFKYRLSAAIDTDTMGDVTSATTAGVAVTAVSDGMLLWIDVDPSAVAETADRRFLRVVLTPNAEMASCIVGVTAFLDTRYKGANIPSST
jgi:hypothetical protein